MPATTASAHRKIDIGVVWNVALYRIAYEDFANLQSGHFGQHQIENNESRFFAARFLQSGSAIGRSGGRKARFAQIKREKIDHIAFILDDQNWVV
jgi:hypothetical protein